jgi:superfamily II DNA or RNA helicase
VIAELGFVRTAAPELRDYQRDAVRVIAGRLAAGCRRGYFTLPTGTGKTRVLAELVAREPGRVLVIAHRLELVDQLRAAMTAAVGAAAVGVVGAGEDEPGRRVTVATVQALRGGRGLARALEGGPVALALIDECHHVTAGNSYGRLVERLAAAYPGVVVLGCTATPWRADADRMQAVLPTCLFARTVMDMQAAGWLAPLRWERCELEGLRLDGLRLSRIDGERDYAPAELAAEIDRPELTAEIAERTAALLAGERSVVFAASVAHAHHLAAAYRAAGLRALPVWGNMGLEDRADALARWRAGRLDVISNVAVLTEGYDLPELSRVVIARPTRSPGLYVQMLGRALRPMPGKPWALAVDVVGNPNAADVAQITLPALLGYEPIPGRAPWGLQGPGSAPRHLVILDPIGGSPHSWVEAAAGIFALSLGHGMTACLRPAPDGSGLYWPEVLQAGGRLGMCREPLPLREAVGAVAGLVGRAGAAALAERGRRWREGPPSAKALELLRRLDPPAFHSATGDSWSAGEVSEGITAAIVARQYGLQPSRAAEAAYSGRG